MMNREKSIFVVNEMYLLFILNEMEWHSLNLSDVL